jgi:hypothetical protein
LSSRPVEERDKQFCIFIDEFQNFASYQDFPVLITQAPKYGVATTLAHHERYGQLAGQFEIMGATAAIANKVLFQITARDAQELAPEFSEEPTTETRYEEGYIISREPVWDLLRWHDNPTIREFANRYIRPLKERLEDIKGGQETERLIRTEYLDDANMYRISDVLEGSGRFTNINRDREALSSAGRMMEEARGQTRQLMTLSQEATHISNTFRALNKLFFATMDGTIDIHSQQFINYLVTGITAMAGLSDIERKAIAFYLTVRTAQWYVKSIPFDVAKAYGLFPDKVKENEKEVDDELAQREREYTKTYYYCSWFDYRDVSKYVDPRKEPKNITTGIGTREVEHTMRAIYNRNKSIIEKLQEFIQVCGLLSRPENHIMVRSGQYAAKQVNIRTEADMTNEMVRNLVSLPKYTAYAKILQDEGSRVWTGKIRTLELGATTAGAATGGTIDYVGSRWRVQEEIAERHKRLLRKVAGDNGPPPFVY